MAKHIYYNKPIFIVISIVGKTKQAGCGLTTAVSNRNRPLDVIENSPLSGCFIKIEQDFYLMDGGQ